MPKEDYLPDPTKWIDTAPSTSSAHKKRAQRPLVQRRYGLMTPPATAVRHVRPGESSNDGRYGKGVVDLEATPSRSAANYSKGKAVSGKYGVLPMTSAPPSARTPLAQLERNRVPPSKLSRQASIGGFLAPVSNPPAAKRSKINPSLDDKQDVLDFNSPSVRAAASTGRGLPSCLTRTGRLRELTRRDSNPDADSEEARPVASRSSTTTVARGSEKDSSGSSPRDIRKTAMLAALNAGGPLYMPDDLLDPDDDPSPQAGSSTSNATPARSRTAPRGHGTASTTQGPFLDQSPAKAASPLRPAATPEQPPPSSVPPIGLTPVPAHVMQLHARLCGRDEERMAKIKSPWKKRSPVPQPSEGRRRPLGPAKSMFDMTHNPFKDDDDDQDTNVRCHAPMPGRGGKGLAAGDDTGTRKTAKRKRASSETDEYPRKAANWALMLSPSRNGSVVDARPNKSPVRSRSPDRPVSPAVLTSSSPKSSPPRAVLDVPLIGSAVKSSELEAALQARSSSPTPTVTNAAKSFNLWSEGSRTGSSEAARSSSPSRPSLVESQVYDPAFESLPATYFSQPFPRLLSSPPPGGISKERSFASTGGNISAPASRSSTPSTLPLRRSGWQDLQSVILQVPLARKDTSESIPALPASSSSGSTDLWHIDTNPEITANGTLVPRSSRKRKRKDIRDTQSQSQLAAFGFFPQQKKKNPKRPDFERDWDDEVDLRFDVEEAKDDLLPERQASQRTLDGNSGLASVPEAPAHPSLRAAGIRELEKRRHASSSTPTRRPAVTPLQRSAADLAGSTHSSSHNDPASTLTTSSESGLPALGSETTRWWEQIEDRGPGEFRTPSEPPL